MAEISVALAGDCMVTRGALVSAEPGGRALRDLLHGADFAVANLEVVANDWQGFPTRDAWGGGLVASSQVLDELRDLGVTALAGANNHALDMGVEGLLATIEQLRRRGFPYAGIGRTLTEARMPAYVDRAAGSLALLACTSTFGSGQDAAEASPELPGRPGVNPLRHRVELRITAEQVRVLREIDADTGLRAQRADLVEMIGADPWDRGAAGMTFLGVPFTVAESAGRRTAAEPADAEAIAGWVRDARRRADVVVVSVHCHESGATTSDPPDFLREFAHRVVDEGADAVLGHGPHALRGMEIYRRKPIFYSLGSLVNQLDLVERLSAESYAQLPEGTGATPAAFFASRSDNGRRGLGVSHRYAETVVPVLGFEDGQLAGVCLHPVTPTTAGQPHGRPEIAAPADAGPLLCRFAALSAAYGVAINVAGGVGQVEVS